MRIVYMAHPVGAPTPEGVTANLARARRWARWIIDNFPDVAIAMDWIVWCEILDDFNPEHRARGMRMNKAQIATCSEFWMVGGRISNGMGDELATAREHRLQIYDLTWLGEEPPVEVPERVRALCA